MDDPLLRTWTFYSQKLSTIDSPFKQDIDYLTMEPNVCDFNMKSIIVGTILLFLIFISKL